MRSFRRLCGIVLCAVLVLSMLFSSVYIVCAANHSCYGQNCRVCVMITRAEALLHSMAVLLTVCTLLHGWFVPVCLAICVPYTHVPAYDTPVQWKTRLNN